MNWSFIHLYINFKHNTISQMSTCIYDPKWNIACCLVFYGYDKLYYQLISTWIYVTKEFGLLWHMPTYMYNTDNSCIYFYFVLLSIQVHQYSQLHTMKYSARIVSAKNSSHGQHLKLDFFSKQNASVYCGFCHKRRSISF